MPTKVTDPELLRQLNGEPSRKPVTDPALIQRLNQQAAAPVSNGVRTNDVFNRTPEEIAADVEKARLMRQGNFGDQLMSGVVEGVAGTLNLPTTISELLYNAPGWVSNKVAGTEFKPTDFQGVGDWYLRDQTDMGHVKEPSDNWMTRDARKVAQYATGAVIPGGNIKQMVLGGVGAGTGAAVAGHVAPGNPLVEAELALLGGGAGLGTGLATRAGSAAKSAPSVQALKTEASALYQQAERRGIVAPPASAIKLADDMFDIGKTEGAISPTGRFNDTFPDVAEAIRTFDDYASAGIPLSVKDLQVIRSKLTEAARSAKPTEKRVAMVMLRKFDEFVDPLAPELKLGNALYRRHMVGDMIDTQIALAKSDAARNPSLGLDGALRNRFAELDRHIIRDDGVAAGLSVAEIAAIKKAANGGAASNTLRMLGKLAPSGVVSFGVGATAPAYLATQFGASPLSAGAVGVGAMGLGVGSRLGATAMTNSAAQQASALARRGGPSAGGLPGAGTSLLGTLGSVASNANANMTQQNKTMDYLRKNYPDLAAEVEAGMPIADALKRAMQVEANRNAMAAQ